MNNSSNAFFYIGFCMTIIILLRGQTNWLFPHIIDVFLYYGAIIILFFHFIFNIQRFNPSIIIMALILLPILLIIGKNTEQTYRLISTFLIVVGSIKINYYSILKKYWVVSVIFCLCTVCGSYFGFVKGLKAEAGLLDRMSISSLGLRYSFGYAWATDFASHIFFLILVYWNICKGVFNTYRFLIISLIVIFCSYYTDTRLSLLLCLIILIFSLIINNNPKIYYNKNIYRICIAIVILSPIIAFALVVLFDPLNPFWEILNLLLSGRLSLCSNAIYEEGFCWFGQKVIMVGSGQDEATNYIDISYIQLAIIFGFIYLCILILIHISIVIKSYLERDIVTSISIALVSIEALIAQHYGMIEFCPLLLYLLSKKNED